MRRKKTRADVADLIERFLQNCLAYPQEWNDFVECSQGDPAIEAYTRRCYDLDPLVNRPDPVDEDAIAELRGIYMHCVLGAVSEHVLAGTIKKSP